MNNRFTDSGPINYGNNEIITANGIDQMYVESLRITNPLNDFTVQVKFYDAQTSTEFISFTQVLCAGDVATDTFGYTVKKGDKIIINSSAIDPGAWSIAGSIIQPLKGR